MYLLSSPVSGATPARTERAKEATLTKRAASAYREIQNLRHEVPFSFVFAHSQSYNPTWSVDVSVVRSFFLSMCLLAGSRALTVQAQKRNLMSLSPSFYFAALCPVPTASMCAGVLGKTRAARRLERSRQTAAHSVPDHFLKEKPYQ